MLVHPMASRSTRWRVLALCVGLAPAVLAGCGSSSGAAKPGGTGPVADLGDPTDLTNKAEVTVDVVDNTYTPRVLSVSPGTKIVFKNTGVNVHNVTPNTEGDFTALVLNPGQSGTIVAPQGAKAYRYYCTIHAGLDSGLQRGALIVTAP